MSVLWPLFNSQNCQNLPSRNIFKTGNNNLGYCRENARHYEILTFVNNAKMDHGRNANKELTLTIWTADDHQRYITLHESHLVYANYNTK